uniref:Uncharacterized protein n=1 Tax=Lepeophtheirus salmonis TaxID=72036 RepID=A0A0K2THY2_LEPSM
MTWLDSGSKRYGPFLTRFEPTVVHFGEGNQQDLTPKCRLTEVLHSGCMGQLVRGVRHQLLHGL